MCEQLLTLHKFSEERVAVQVHSIQQAEESIGQDAGYICGCNNNILGLVKDGYFTQFSTNYVDFNLYRSAFDMVTQMSPTEFYRLLEVIEPFERMASEGAAVVAYGGSEAYFTNIFEESYMKYGSLGWCLVLYDGELVLMLDSAEILDSKTFSVLAITAGGEQYPDTLVSFE